MKSPAASADLPVLKVLARARAEVASKARGLTAPLRCVDAIEGACTLPFEQGLANERAIFIERVQSPDVPMRRIWRWMVSPLWCFHSQTFSMNLSRPRESRVSPLPSAARLRPTTISVAMPAWSVPICQSVSKPRMRW